VERLEAQQQIRRVQNVVVVSKKTDRAQIERSGPQPKSVNMYAYPHWPGGEFSQETIDQFNMRNWLTVRDDEGKPLDFGEEVIDVVVVPHRRFAELVHFWEIEARSDPEKRNQVQLVALGSYNIFNGPGIQQQPTTPDLSPTIHVELIVIYREKQMP